MLDIDPRLIEEAVVRAALMDLMEFHSIRRSIRCRRCRRRDTDVGYVEDEGVAAAIAKIVTTMTVRYPPPASDDDDAPTSQDDPSASSNASASGTISSW